SATALRRLACDAHHLTHWADDGPTSLDNLVLLCRAHHTLIHATPWQVRLNPLDRRPEFRRPPRHGQPPPTGHWIRALPARE
ncbi:MAG: HNH endonuclease signature motif containing protein, partial [Nocardioides sp.]